MLGRYGVWFILLILNSCFLHGTECPAQGKPGIWSAHATYLCSHAAGDGFARDIIIPSPDHSASVHVVNDHWYVQKGQTRLELTAKESYVSYYPAELSWSPDSKAFYITQSDATSEIDGFHTEIYLVDDRLSRQDINQLVESKFRQKHKCVLRFENGPKYDENDFNIAGLKWLSRSDQLLVITEIPPDSACGPRGYFGGYLLNLKTQHVDNTYSPRELSEHWGDAFGVRLKSNNHQLRASLKNMMP